MIFGDTKKRGSKRKPLVNDIILSRINEKKRKDSGGS